MAYLNDNEEQLVADLAADYCEHFISGHEPPIREYLDKLSNDQSKTAFRRAVNMSRLLITMQRIHVEEPIAI